MAEVLVGAGDARQRAVADVLVELAPMHPDLATMPVVWEVRGSTIIVVITVMSLFVSISVLISALSVLVKIIAGAPGGCRKA